MLKAAQTCPIRAAKEVTILTSISQLHCMANVRSRVDASAARYPRGCAKWTKVRPQNGSTSCLLSGYVESFLDLKLLYLSRYTTGLRDH